MTFASDTCSIPLICWYTSDTSGSGSVLFLLVLFVVKPFFAFLVACWTLCLENPRGFEWCCLLQSSSDADLQWGQSCLLTQGLRDLRLAGKGVGGWRLLRLSLQGPPSLKSLRPWVNRQLCPHWRSVSEETLEKTASLRTSRVFQT